MGLNNCAFTGRMTDDAEPISANTTGVRFRLAVDGYDFGAKAKKTTFVPCVTFSERTVNVLTKFAGKGREIAVVGRYDVREFTPTSGPNAGVKRQDHSFIIETVELLSGQPAGQRDPNAGNFQANAADPSPSGW